MKNLTKLEGIIAIGAVIIIGLMGCATTPKTDTINYKTTSLSEFEELKKNVKSNVKEPNFFLKSFGLDKGNPPSLGEGCIVEGYFVQGYSDAYIYK